MVGGKIFLMNKLILWIVAVPIIFGGNYLTYDCLTSLDPLIDCDERICFHGSLIANGTFFFMGLKGYVGNWISNTFDFFVKLFGRIQIFIWMYLFLVPQFLQEKQIDLCTY